MIIKTLMLSDPPIVTVKDKLVEAFKKVNIRGIGRVIVTNDSIEGIISTRDLLTFVTDRCEEGCNRGDIFALIEKRVAQVMTPKPVFAYEDDDVMDALTLMVARNFGALPVLSKEKKVSGIITEREFLLIFQDLDELFPVKKFMTKKVTTVYEDVPVFEAVKLMIRRGFRRLPIINDQQKVIGIITAADALKLFTKAVLKSDPEMFFTKKVSQVATKDVLAIDPEKSINEAAGIMIMKKVGSLLILKEDGSVGGIITERDLIIALHYQLHLKSE
ncbi:CBS domain-containing protein [Stygiolobus caldivivus]|uniref:Histidine kinase n=1 Tax=Stygiolobus caldivivus TaxID=2824673 RepID=A0A8D5U7X2_9CREN|nr:CBS domain-containing protein [Stygiolobus caldivivus]BCU70983.1 histidine kinase [Stygiolobus caldivivus]